MHSEQSTSTSSGSPSSAQVRGMKAVVRRIVCGGIKDTVEAQGAGLLIHFVFVLAALFDLDDGEEVLRGERGGAQHHARGS